MSGNKPLEEKCPDSNEGKFHCLCKHMELKDDARGFIEIHASCCRCGTRKLRGSIKNQP